MGLFQGDPLLVTHQPAQEVSGKGATGKELGVGAPVRRAGEGIGRVIDHLGGVFGVEPAVRTKELNVEIASERQVQHDLNRVLALFLSNLAERLTNVPFQLGLPTDTLDNQVRDRSAYASLDDL